jgi:hypothetical protein
MERLEIDDRYDKEFISLIVEIEKRCQNFTKQDKLKIDSWVGNKKLFLYL